MQRSRVTENMEEKWKRLCPDWYDGHSAGSSWQKGSGWYEGYTAGGKWQQDNTAPHNAATSSPANIVPQQKKARKDEPQVRHLRRGTTMEALKALVDSGTHALIDHLLKDRYAKGTAEANASLIST